MAHVFDTPVAAPAGRRYGYVTRAQLLAIGLGRPEFHRFKSSFEGDRERDAKLLAADYPTVRVTEERFKQTPEEEARRLHKILAARRGA
jgi:hypothetical protein